MLTKIVVSVGNERIFFRGAANAMIEPISAVYT